MSFRQYGGMKYASKHNIVNSNYNTSNNLLVTQNVGQPNSFINFESDISGNILVYGDFDLSGNLNVGGNIDCSGNLTVAGYIDCSDNLNVGGNIDTSGNLTVAGYIDCSDNITAEYMFLSSGTNYSNDQNAVMPKSYIDLTGSSIKYAGQVLAISDPSSNGYTGPVPISPSTISLPYYIDGIDIQVGQSVLLNDQPSAINNGVYILDSDGSGGGIFNRSTTILPTGSDATSAFVSIVQGDNYGRTGWLQTNTNNGNPVTVGTDALNFFDYYNLNFKLGQGLFTTSVGIETYLNVDSSLNFLTLVDASSSNPILNIGTENATNINMGNSDGSTLTNIYGVTTINTSAGSSLVSALQISDTLSFNSLYFLPNALATDYNYIIQTGDVVITTASWYTPITLTIGGNVNSSGIRLDNTQLVVGYGGTSDIPTTSLVCDGSYVNINGQNVSINAPTTIATNYGLSSTSSFTVFDNISVNALYTLPYASSGAYNNIVITGDVSLIGINSLNENNANLTLTTWSDTCSGLRITPTSVMIGAGGTVSTSPTPTIPTSNMLFSDTTASLTGNLSIPAGNTYLSLNLQEIQSYSNIEIPNDLGQNILKLVDSSNSYSLDSRSVMIELLRNGINNQNWAAQACISMGNYTNANEGTAIDFDLSYLSSTGSGGNFWDFVTVMSLWSVSTTEGRVGINNANPNYTLDVDGSANITGELRVTTDYGVSSNQSLLVQDSISTNAFNVLPNIGGGQYNLITQPGDVTLLSLTGGNIGNPLTITTQSSTCVGIRITPTSVMLGAGGSNTTPTANILCSGTSVSITGDVTCDSTITAQSFETTSDYRLKTNIRKLDETYSVDKLEPVEYDIKGKHDMGFIAHEVQEHFPFLVSGEKDGEQTQSINYTGLIALLVKEIQELKKKYKMLETRKF